MKMKKSYIIVPVVIVVALIAVVAKLSANKKQFNEAIAFAQRKVEKIPVSVATVGNGILSEDVIATGTLEASEVLNLVAETQGKIIKKFKDKGDKVAPGDVIAKVDDEVISATVLTAEANYAQFEKDVERLTRLAEQNAVTKRDLEQTTIGMKKAKADLINARKALDNTSIKSPISGVINSDFVTEGQFLAGGTKVCEIVNNNQLKLNIKITEFEVYKIEQGQPVEIRLSVFPDKKFTGIITAIAEKADAALKFNVEITLDNDVQAHLRSGLYAEALLPIKNQERLLIDKACIVGSMEHPEVFIAQNGKAVKRQLITGQSNDKRIEVLSGLNPGEQVIVSGQLNLKDGDEINVIK